MLPRQHTQFRNKSLDMAMSTSPEERTYQVTALKTQSAADVVPGNSSVQTRDIRAFTRTQKLVVNLFALQENDSLESHMGRNFECGHENDLNVSNVQEQTSCGSILACGNTKFKLTCWFCGRLFDDQEQWMSHGQQPLTEAT